jgi:hypothetical protein
MNLVCKKTAEQSQLLMAVHDILRIVKIQDNDLGRLDIRSEKMIHKTLCNPIESTMGNHVFQPAERWLTG